MTTTIIGAVVTLPTPETSIVGTPIPDAVQTTTVVGAVVVDPDDDTTIVGTPVPLDPTQGENLGVGVGVFARKAGDGATMDFRSLVGGANVTLTANGDEIQISAAGAIPGGPDGAVQFNNAGALGGDAGLIYDGALLEVGAPAAPRASLFTVAANAGSVFRVLDDNGDNQLNIITTLGSESITLGNNNTAPNVFMLGTGIQLTVGADGGGSVNAAVIGPGPFDLAHGIAIGTTAPAGAVTLGRAGQTLALNGAITGAGTFDFNCTFNVTPAFRVRRDSDNYYTAATTSGAGTNVWGNATGAGFPTTHTFFMANGQSSAFGVQNQGNPYLRMHTSGGGLIQFGNTNTNPAFEFHGDGPLEVGQSGDNTAVKIRERANDPTREPDYGSVYVKQGPTTAQSELFYRDDLVAVSVAQLTMAGYARGDIMASSTVAGAPAATPAGRWLFITDETGGAVPAFSDGTDWRRCTDRVVIS